MNTAALQTFGYFNPHHEYLKKAGLSPCERDVFGKIAGISRSKKIIYISLSRFAEDLGYVKETICKAVSKLIKKGFLRKTGEKHLGFYSVVEIIARGTESLITPPAIRSMSIDHYTNALRPYDQTQEIKVNLIKQTEKEPVVVDQYLEKNLLKQILKDFGIGSNKAQDLLTRFPVERIECQIDSLKGQLESGKEIKNPAGWLLKAIERNFRPSTGKKIEQPPASIIQEEQDAEKSRASYNLLKSAELCESRQEYTGAIKLAQQSLAIQPQKAAQELINRIELARTKEAHRAKALAAIPKEEFERVFAEEIEKQKTILMRLGLSKVTELHTKAATAATIERLIE